MTSADSPIHTFIPRVGVGIIVQSKGRVLLGLRTGSHGSGTWSVPGGHLEFGETIEQCAVREVLEETGLSIDEVKRGPYTNDVFEAEGKHYVTIFVTASSESGEPKIMEPSKCSRWKWFRWSELPSPLFQPLETLLLSGYVPDKAA